MTTRTDIEAQRSARVPGTTFRDGVAGRRPRIAGHPAVDVHVVVRHFLAFGRDWDEVRHRFDWIPEEGLRAALRYYELYPDEIDQWLERERKLTPEHLYQKYPFTWPA